MNKPLKNILTAVFILLASLPLIYALFFIINKACIHQRMREELNRRELTTVILDKSNLQWMEEGRELLIDDRMFDVVKIDRKSVV